MSDFIGKLRIAIRHTANSGNAVFDFKVGSANAVQFTREATFVTSNIPISIGGTDTVSPGRGYKGLVSCNIYNNVKSDTEINAFLEVGM